jgi:exoribonuclease II
LHVFYEEDGGFKAATILSSTPPDGSGSHQVEDARGKRSKIKAAQVMVRFASPDPASFQTDVAALADSVDVDFLWQCAPPDEFEFTALAAEYHGRAASSAEAAALLMRLHGAPMYFYKKGKGRYKAAPEDSLKAALASVEKKKQAALVQAEWEAELEAGRCPADMLAVLPALLYKPDKNSIAYKALDAIAQKTQRPQLAVLRGAGAVTDAHDYHLGRFLFEHFPKGEAPGAGAPLPSPESYAPPQGLPAGPANAFSVDDSTTTEIDDAFSLQYLPDGLMRVGIHIAAPGTGVAPGSPVDVIARQRLSTVYMPGRKLTMLPETVISAYSLTAGLAVPALTLYVDVDAAYNIVAQSTRLESLAVADNLRHDVLDDVVTTEALAADSGGFPYAQEIGWLWRFAQHLENARGMADSKDRIDYNFYVDAGRVTITQRKRGAPLDKLVAELMILANVTWGKLIADANAPGLYRSQAPGGKVKMGTHALPHEGLGVAQYAWSSSPLRRYVDLVNQWQVLAITDSRAVPFKKNDSDLFATLSAFDSAYTAYGDIQDTMERYWCLRWLAQEGYVGTGKTLAARTTREGARLDAIPLYLKPAGLPALPPGTPIMLTIGATDEWGLEAQATFAGEVLADGPVA